MSARQATYNQLFCDASKCGAVYEHIGKPVSHLRELAAKDGWRYLQMQYSGSHWLRRVDLCPKCHDVTELARR